MVTKEVCDAESASELLHRVKDAVQPRVEWKSHFVSDGGEC